jgi:hypothetical protein
MKKMSKIGFLAPFESARYIAGLERNFLVNIPLRASVNLDIENTHVDAALKFINSSQHHQLLQWSTLPFTTRHDILSMRPAIEGSNAKVIHVRPAKSVSHGPSSRQKSLIMVR